MGWGVVEASEIVPPATYPIDLFTRMIFTQEKIVEFSFFWGWTQVPSPP